MAKQYMKYIAVGGVALEVNKEIEKGAKVILMVPFLQTDHCGSHTAGYNVLFEKVEDKNCACENTINKQVVLDKIKEVCFSPEKE